MKFFIDTADLEEIREALSWGVLSGVTTNPSLYAKTGGKLADFEGHMVKICEMCEGLPVSAESQAKTCEGMVADGRRLAALAPNIVVKLPICAEALAATRQLASEGIRVNMTLVFSVPQALLAANALALATSARSLVALMILPRTVSRSSRTSWPPLGTTTGPRRTWTVASRLSPHLCVRLTT